VKAMKSHFKESRSKKTKILPLRDWRKLHQVPKRNKPQEWNYKKIEGGNWNKD